MEAKITDFLEKIVRKKSRKECPCGPFICVIAKRGHSLF